MSPFCFLPPGLALSRAAVARAIEARTPWSFLIAETKRQFET